MSARAISGTRRAFKELVDGTLRVQIDVDPDSRRDFLRLFPDIDMRVAIAPLKGDAADDATKGGAIAKLAGILCGDNDFRMWLQSVAPREALALGLKVSADDPAERAAVVVRCMCGVISRAELDHDSAAAERFHERIRKPWLAFKGGQ
jgi:hypothetical protein